jgi:hypothetical protein
MGFQSFEDFFQWILDCLEHNKIPTEDELIQSEIDEIDKEVQKEETICHLRKIAYGLSACHNCPVSCPVSQDNLNRLSIIETILEKAKP